MTIRLLATLLLALLLSACGRGGGERDYLLAPHRPNLLGVIDAEAREVVRVIELSGRAPWTVVPSADGEVAYALVEGNRRLTGVHLGDGSERFRADFDEGSLRVTSPGALALRPGSDEIFVYQHPVEIASDRYTVQDTRVAVYRSGDGLEARPVRTFEAERRTMVLAFSPDGSRLYAFSWDIVVYDPDSGEELERIPFTNWEREGYGPPDYFDGWPSFERPGLWVAPWVASKGEEFIMGMASLDLASGEFRTVDVEPASKLIFSVAANPARPSEAFGVYTTLSKIDLEAGALQQRIDLDHTYYSVQVSTDGSEVYVGSTLDDIGVYAAEDLRKLGAIRLPSGNDQGIGALRIVRRAPWD